MEDREISNLTERPDDDPDSRLGDVLPPTASSPRGGAQAPPPGNLVPLRPKPRTKSGKPGDGKPGDGKPGDGKPGDGKPGGGEPGGGKPGGGKPGGGEPGGGGSAFNKYTKG